MLVNLIATPLLLRGLGEAAYGLHRLVAVIIGYLTIMDAGLDLPIIKFLDEDRAKNDIESENRLLSTALQLYGAIGLIGMVVIVLAADWACKECIQSADGADTSGNAGLSFGGNWLFG